MMDSWRDDGGDDDWDAEAGGEQGEKHGGGHGSGTGAARHCRCRWGRTAAQLSDVELVALVGDEVV